MNFRYVSIIVLEFSYSIHALFYCVVVSTIPNLICHSVYFMSMFHLLLQGNARKPEVGFSLTCFNFSLFSVYNFRILLNVLKIKNILFVGKRQWVVAV